jgi:hypothetical protein
MATDWMFRTTGLVPRGYHHEENSMTDQVFVSRYEKRVMFVQDVLKKNSKLSDKAARELATQVVHAIDHIPEERR